MDVLYGNRDDNRDDSTSLPASSPVASFFIGFTRYLAADGRALHPFPTPVAGRDELVRLYRAMVLTRTFDAKAVALQRTGRLGTFASSLGQEAVSVGVGAAMRPDDVLLPSFREQGAQFLRGVLPEEILLYWGGDERGSNYCGPREDFPISVPIGTHAPHAAGVAMAFQLRGDARVAVCVLGDGSTSRGDVYEAMNLAGSHHLPLVFVVSNNQWAISLPRSAQTAAQTLAQKAIGCGFPGEQIDGNDIVAVVDRVGAAIERARAGGGPTLIEAVTYRLSDHTTADDASRYRNDAEVSEQWQQEPILRLRTYLVGQGWWTTADEESLLRDCSEQIDHAVATYLGIGPQEPTSMFDSLYAELPPALLAQRDEVSVLHRGVVDD